MPCQSKCIELGQAVKLGSGRGCKYVCRHTSLFYQQPELMKEWHWDKNKNIDPRLIRENSHMKVWWLCSNNICSCHEWTSSPNTRISCKSGCPYCSSTNRKACKHYNLAILFPSMVTEWHIDNYKSIYECTPFTKLNVKWICQFNNNHIWYANISSRTSKGYTGCPYCSNRLVSIENSLYFTHPELCKQWSHLNKITPYEVTFGSSINIIWNCEFNHIWEALISTRTNCNSGCPYCSNKKVCQDNCLAKTNPKLCEEWDPSNEKTIYEITFGSMYRAKWICQKNKKHTWLATVNSRTSTDCGCPYCNQSHGEKNIEQLFTKYQQSYQAQYIIPQLPKKRYDYYFIQNNCHILIEFDGIQHFVYCEYFHKTPEKYQERQQVDRLKTFTAINNGYKLIRLSYKTLEEGCLEDYLNYAVNMLLTTDIQCYLSHPPDYQYLFTSETANKTTVLP